MKVANLTVIAVFGYLSTAVLTFGQVGTPVAKLDPEKEAMIAHYRKLLEDTRNGIKELRLALGEPGEGLGGKRPGVGKLEDLTRQIALQTSELTETKRLISRGESKQKVIRKKLVRIETELSRSLKEKPNDPVAQALQKLVEIDESASQRMKEKFERGLISSDELSNTERKLAESRLELAKHQWEESAEARKALAAASSALEEAVFETEMLSTESAELQKEIGSLREEQARIDAIIHDETESSMRAADLDALIQTIRSGNTELQVQLIERLRKLGVEPYDPGKSKANPVDPSKAPKD
jgi:hypothetical protein